MHARCWQKRVQGFTQNVPLFLCDATKIVICRQMLKNYALSDFMQTYPDVVQLLRGNRTGETTSNLLFFFTNVQRIMIKRTLVTVKGCSPCIIITCLDFYHNIRGVFVCSVGCSKSTADRTFVRILLQNWK